MVLVFSSNSNVSQQVLNEVERAVSKGIVIIPFRIEDTPLSKAMEYFISSKHWLDAHTPPLEAHLGKLTYTVSGILKGEQWAGASTLNSGPSVSQLNLAASYLRDLAKRRTMAFLGGCVALLLLMVICFRLVIPSTTVPRHAPSRGMGDQPIQFPAYTPPPRELTQLQSKVSSDIRGIGGISSSPEENDMMSKLMARAAKADELIAQQNYAEAKTLLEELAVEVTRTQEDQTARKTAAPLLTRASTLLAYRKLLADGDAVDTLSELLQKAQGELAKAPMVAVETLGDLQVKIAEQQTIEEKVFTESFFSESTSDYNWADGTVEELAGFAARYHAGWSMELWGLKIGMTLDEIQQWCDSEGIGYMGFHTNLILPPMGEAYMQDGRKQIPLAILEDGAVELQVNLELTPFLGDDLPERVYAIEIRGKLGDASSSSEVLTYLEKKFGPPVRRTEREWSYRGACISNPADSREELLPNHLIETGMSSRQHFVAKNSDHRLRNFYEDIYRELHKRSKSPDDLPSGPAVQKYSEACAKIAEGVMKLEFRGVSLGMKGGEATAISKELMGQGFKWSSYSDASHFYGTRKGSATDGPESLSVRVDPDANGVGVVVEIDYEIGSKETEGGEPSARMQLARIVEVCATYGKPVMINLDGPLGASIYYTGWTWAAMSSSVRNPDEPLLLIEPVIGAARTRFSLMAAGRGF